MGERLRRVCVGLLRRTERRVIRVLQAHDAPRKDYWGPADD